MLPRKICFIGLHILFTLHIAHSFVLLTANMEDLKKLARKFVSDQFAEKIVELIAKATSNLLTPAPNVSEENEANVDDIQKVSDNEVMDPYKGRQAPKFATRTTPSRYADNSKEVVRPKHMKVNSHYAESDLRSQELTELSEYRNPVKLPIVKPNDYSSERKDHKLMNILRQSPLPQYLVAQKPKGDKETIQLSNVELKKPKISYHKSKIPDDSRNFGAQYASVNIGGGNREKTNPSSADDRYYPVTDQPDKERKPKILNLKYQGKNDRNKEYFVKIKEREDQTMEPIGKDKEIQDKSEEYLGKVRQMAGQERQDQYKKNTGKLDERFEVKPGVMEKLNVDPQTASNTSKNDTLHMFVQKGDQLQEVTLTTRRERVEFDQYQPRHKHKRASKPRKSKYKNKVE